MSLFRSFDGIDPHDALTATPVRRKQRLLYALLVIAGAGASVLLLATLGIYRNTPTGRSDLQHMYLATSVVLLSVLLVYALSRWTSVEVASSVFLFLLVVAIAVSDDPAEVVDGRVLIAFAVPILAASMLLPAWASFVYAGLSSLALLLVGMTIPGKNPSLPAMMSFFALAAISWLYARSIERGNQALRASNAQLQDSEARFRRLAENATDIIFRFQLQPTRRFDYISPAVETITGYQQAAFYADAELGEQLIHTDDIPDWSDTQPVGQAAVSPLSLRLVRKDGSIVWVEMRNVPICDKGGNVVAVEGVVRDITERKAFEDALQELNLDLERRVEARTTDLRLANSALAEASHLKDEFLANMSHELRTPLASILNAVELLEDGVYGALPTPQLRPVSLIEHSARHLLGLINDILDLSKVEAGRLHLQIERFPAADAAQESLEFVSEQARRKRIQLTLTTEPAGFDIEADRQRLTQILVNLLSNAVKFTPEEGSVGLELQADAKQGCAHFAVWDTGIGIAEEDRARLFRPFVQLDSGLTRRHSGTGLGLSLVRRLAELHNGSVEVASTPGQGSRFTVTMPWTPPSVAPSPSEEVRATDG